MNGFTGLLWTLAAESGAHKLEPLFDHPYFRIDSLVVAEWAVMLVLVLIAFVLGRNISKVPRTKIQGMLELLLAFLEGWLAGFVGSRKDARRFLPLLGTFFLFIIISNYSGLLPGAGEDGFFIPPTGKWGTTLGLGLVSMGAVLYVGIKDLGFGSWFKHLLGFEYGAIGLIMGPLHILEEFAVRPFSLSLRLFGNIFAEEQLLHVIAGLAPLLIPIPIMLLSLLFGGIQAIVFTTLCAIYIGGMVQAAQEHHAHHAHHHDSGEHDILSDASAPMASH